MLLPLHNMRLFHNNIKRKYIDKYIDSPSTLLDLACGKGGDIPKWKSNKFIKSVTGYDINEESIIEAKKRLKNLKVNKSIKFYIKDLSKENLHCKLKYDIITSFFAFHYFFKNNKTLKTILSSIDNCSKSGSLLILALFDGNKVHNINNKDYSLKLLDKKKLEVYIKNSVLDNPEIEYIVKPSILIKKLNTINFELIESTSFKELNALNTRFKLTKDEQILSFMNRIYIFKKI